MDEHIKILAMETVNKIYRKIRTAKAKEFHRFSTRVGIGADGTPTEYVDKLAEDTAIRFLKKAEIPVNVLSEEAGFIDMGGDYTFVLDPVDGSRNAYRGIPFYAVSLAVGKNMLSDVEYGIVKNIPTGDTYTGEKGRGAFLNKQPVITPDSPGRDVISCLSLGKNHDERTIALADNNIVRSLGSAALEMCMVAVGALDVYMVGKEYLRVTDIAASTLIVREAGGIVTDSSGKSLDMQLSLDYRTSVIASCNWELIHCIPSTKNI